MATGYYYANRTENMDLRYDEKSSSWKPYSGYTQPVRKVYISNTTFTNCKNITSVNLHNHHWTNGSMHSAFQDCSNLTSCSGIGNNVTTLRQAFRNCYLLTTPPSIPNTVTNMSYSFGNCYALQSYPIIPDGVKDLTSAFQWVNKLTTPPTIPNSVTSLCATFAQNFNLSTLPRIPDSVVNCARTFYACNNVGTINYTIPINVTNVESMFHTSTAQGNVFILSTKITNAVNFANLSGKSKRMNVYIPFTYSNSVATQTYNAFTSAGYNTAGSGKDIYLMDIGTFSVDLTGWTYTQPDEITAVISKYTGSSTTITVPKGV